MAEPQVLWTHPAPEATEMWLFLERINSRYGTALANYADLYKWSVDNLELFWLNVWETVGIAASEHIPTTAEDVLPSSTPMFPYPPFFRHTRLNFAQNLLYPPINAPADPDTTPAVIALTETTTASPRITTWSQLRDAVRRCSAALRARGVGPRDVVAGYVANHTPALVAMLAAASLGAIWTGISPDNGVSAVLDRLAQIGPKVLFADDATVYNGKTWDCRAKTAEIVQQLRSKGLELLVVVKTLEEEGKRQENGVKDVVEEIATEDYSTILETASDTPQHFEFLPPSHPLYILYSSGTTGLPKAIVHSALGTLLQHKKEHYLHCSLSSRSRLLYYTTTSWMMWHWSVSALAVGASLVLYTGSPFRPHGHMSLSRLLSDLQVTHFGTSAAYLTALEANDVKPVQDPSLDLSRLEAIYSTASPLPPSTFNFVYEAFPSRVNLASITGGTDIISLFGAPCPLLPVKTGEIQCAGLGMAIRAVESDPTGGAAGELSPLVEVPPDEPGDLVCVKPFPCQPLTFFGAEGERKYRAAYFERFASADGLPVWHHGDFVRIPDPRTGALVMLGRSDGVLKPAGVRFGSAEIYNVLTRFFAAEVDDAVCVGRRRTNDKDETVCLFVVVPEGRRFTPELVESIKKTIRMELSPRHVPAVVDECGGGIPKTGNGKKIEVAVKQILSGMAVKTNASVANPDALDWFREWAKTH